MSRVRGKTFPITKNQAKGYGYARAAFRRNPGVTSIAAINGPGAYSSRQSARSVMGRLSRNSRLPAARRALSASQKKAFQAKLSANATRAQRASSRKNIKKAQSARRLWGRKLPRNRRFRVGPATYGRKPKARRLKAGVYVANRRKKAGTSMAARRRRKSATGATKKRRRSSKRRRKTTASASPKRRRRTKKKAKATTKRRRRRSRKVVAKRRTKRTAKRRTRRAAPRRRRRVKRTRSAAPRRRRSRKGKRKAAPRRRMRANRRRHRRNPSRKLASNRRRRHRRNGKMKSNRRRRMRRNGAGDFIKMSGIILLGFGVHRLLTNLLDRQLLARMMPAPAAPVATSGFNLSSQTGLISSLLVGAGGSFAASKLIKNQETKKLVIGGMIASTLQGVIMSLLRQFAPSGADMLSGPEDATAARLSAMYGLGAGASIQPRYAPIGQYFRQPVRGIGEYFREPMSGLGEYFTEPMSGLGEYIAATNGLGTYENNSDLYQAAAGFGNHDYNGNHIDPSGDLDRQLTIAEAAAGVGRIPSFEASAGMGAGPMQAAAGFGAIDTVPSADTWIPGTTDPELWAGVRAVTEPQAATEMTPAGILQTDGGQGIFG